MSDKRILPQDIHEYVVTVAWRTNVILLLCHLVLGIFFLTNHFTLLFGFNCFSILVYLISFFILKKKLSKVYVILVFIEIYLFMFFSIFCVGWDFGFQHYCITFVASYMFADFYRNEMQTSGIDIVLFGTLNGLLYLGLRFYSNIFEPVYHLDNQIVVYLIYFLNTVFAFFFFIMFIYIYNRAVSRMENDLRQMAERDPLTGLYNRRRMLQFLEQAMTEVTETPFAVAMLDIDYFKKVNDTYGHDAGDEVLKFFSRLLTNNTFDKDNYFVSRWGGEEFVVLYRCENNLDTIKENFEALRQKIEEKTVYYGEYKIHITATIGVLTCNTPCEVKELIKEVDDLLYEGKTSGRNVVVSK